MNIKFVIFVVISALLVGAIYSSSTFVVFAAVTSCIAVSKTMEQCTVLDEEDKSFTSWTCTTKNGGKTWSCVEDKSKPAVPPSALNDALTKAGANIAQQQLTTGENDTKVLDRLNDRGINEQSIESNDNNDTKVPKDLGGLNDDLPTLSPDE
jgi:hypothetical protein